MNVQVSNETLFGFKCECTLGYNGDLCEVHDSCIPNPCNSNEKCVSLGNIAYKCLSNNATQLSSTPKIPSTSQQIISKTTSRVIDVTTTVRLTKAKNKGVSTPFASKDCDNFNDDVCNYYAQQNLCSEEYFLSGKPITKKCRKACRICM